VDVAPSEEDLTTGHAFDPAIGELRGEQLAHLFIVAFVQRGWITDELATKKFT